MEGNIMTATWFTSDLHIGHRFVAGLRGFRPPGEPNPLTVDLAAHSQAIAEGWSVIGADDIVWVLGDICISNQTWPMALRLIADFMPGRKRLVCGNHDPVSSIHRDAWKHQRAALEVFESVQDFAKVKMSVGTVLLSHYPYSGAGSEGLRGEDGSQHTERYGEFRLPDYGYPLLHGHTHGLEKLHFSDGGTRQVHVGLDAWNMKPVSQHQVERLLDSRPVTGVKVEA